MNDAVKPVLGCSDLSVELGGRTVLRRLSWQLLPGQWCSVVGRNGAGKSTWLKALAGLIPAAGERQLLGRSLHSFAPRQRAQRVSWLGSGSDANDDLSAREVVMLGRLPHQGLLGGASLDDEHAVDEALQATQVQDLQHRPMGELSAGERQRVLLARAFAVQAQVVLMDEPLSHLDPPHQADWVRAVRLLTARQVAVVSVLHDLQVALMADRISIVCAGELRWSGSTEDANAHRQLENAFGGHVAVVSAGGRWAVLTN
ncbi:MAG: hypothetical protein RLZZ126_910 [Pseudomonadota bacterium]|jgi:iron complex transport system ATP-binding protein